MTGRSGPAPSRLPRTVTGSSGLSSPGAAPARRGWRGGGAQLGADLPDRQPDRRHHRRRPRHHGPGRIRHSPAVGATSGSLSRRRPSAGMAKRAVSALFSAEEPDRLRGSSSTKLWCDELAAWRQPDAFDQAMLGLRLGDKPQAVITTTPRPEQNHQNPLPARHNRHPRLDLDNKATSGRAFLERITARYKGRAIGQQESPPKSSRRRRGSVVAGAARASTRCAGSRAEGIRGDCGRGSTRRRARDQKSTNAGSSSRRKRRTGSFMCSPISPARAKRPALGCGLAPPSRLQANRVVAEINNGGDMVTEVLRQSEPNLPVRAVHATRANSCARSRSRQPTSAVSSFTLGRSRSSKTSSVL